MLSGKLPPDLARHVVRMYACTLVQSRVRGMLARVGRMPMEGNGMEQVRAGEYRYSGSDFGADLCLFCARFRPGVYELEVTMVHGDGGWTHVGSANRVLVCPKEVRWGCTLLEDWEMCHAAFEAFHGPMAHRVEVTKI